MSATTVYDKELGRYTAMSNADRYVHLLSDKDDGNSLCGYAPTQLRPATMGEVAEARLCPTCHYRARRA